MILGTKQEKTVLFALLALFLFLVLVFGFGAYTAALGSDPYGIVHFAHHLSRGEFYSDFPVYDWVRPDWEPGESRFVLGGNYIKAGPRMYNKYTIGFPLLLAFSIRILGEYSVFYFNLIILLTLLVALFWLAIGLLRDQDGGWWPALAAPLILLVMVDPAWRLALRPSHDLAGIMFIVAGAALAVWAFRDHSRIRIIPLLAGAFAFGCAGTLRLPNVLAAVPAGIYFLSRTTGRLRWWKLTLLSLAGIALFFLALSPALVQNQLTSGHPLRPPRPEIVSGERTVLGGLDQASPPPLWIGFFPTTFPETARYFWRLWGPLFTFLGLMGLLSGWRRPETKWLLVGIPLTLILFYSMWVHLMTRYMLVAHPFLIVLMVAGAGRLLRARPRWWSTAGLALIVIGDFLIRSRFGSGSRLDHLDLFALGAGMVLWLLFVRGRRGGKSFVGPAIFTAVFFAFFLVRYGVPWLRRPPIFQLTQARLLGEDIDALIPSESVIISTKPVFQYIHLFSSSYSLRPFEMGRIGVDPREGFDRLLNRGTGLYLLDNSSYKRDAGKAIPLFREYYDLTPVGQLPADRYHLEFQFGKPVCTIYRIESWSEKEVEVEFELPREGSEFLIAFNLRKIHSSSQPRQLLEVELDGQPLPGPFFEGMNFLYRCRDQLSSPSSKLTIRSDRPLPRDIALRAEDLFSSYPVDLAGQTGFPNRAAVDIFAESRLRDADLVRLGWSENGLVTVPTIALPDTVLIAEIEVKKVREMEEPISLRMSLNGEEIAQVSLGRGTQWESLQLPLPARLYSAGRGELEFFVDRPLTRPLTLAEENGGALLFQSITVKRWWESFPLPPAGDLGYFIAFPLAPLPGESCFKPFQIYFGTEASIASRKAGVQRLILKTKAGDPPISRLEAWGGEGDCRLLITRPPVIRTAADRLRINIGDEADWVFLEKGFYPPELHLSRTPVRWTKEVSRIALPLFPRPGREIVLTLKSVKHRPPAAFRDQPRVWARLDGEELGGHPLREEDAIYSWTLPEGPPGPRVAIFELGVDPWRPSSYLPTIDHRKLGLMLEWLEINYREVGE